MFLSIAAKGEHSGDLGFLLYKHPDRLFTKDVNKAKVTGFFPESTPGRSEFCLVVEVDPVERVRGVSWEKGIAVYVEPMPYLAASHMSNAISQAIGSALNGKLESKDPEVDSRIKASGVVAWPLEIKVGPVRCGPYLIQKLFEPLGWSVAIETHPLDVPGVSAEDDRPLHVFTLSGEAVLSEALAHLYVLLPVLDPARHYFYEENEAKKLVVKGGEWLKAHPHRSLIVDRYLSKSRELRAFANELLNAQDFVEDDEAVSDLPEGKKTIKQLNEEYERWSYEESPHGKRHAAIVEAVKASGARRVVDLGCGEGKLLEKLVVLAPDMRVVGVEPSMRSLDRARKALSKLPGGNMDPRVEFVHGSALYADERLKGYDAAILSEVVEHVDPDRLSLLERSVFGLMRPGKVFLTTPNRDHNVYLNLETEFRDHDHRFEWTIVEFLEWAEKVCGTYGYEVETSFAGGKWKDGWEADHELSHFAVFTRKDS